MGRTRVSRRFVAAAVLLALLTVFAGCGQGASPNAGTAPASSAPAISAPAEKASAPASINAKIMSSSPGGDFFTIGSAMGKIFAEQIPGFNLTVAPGGAVGNVEGIENGQTELGFSFNSLAYSAAQGEAPFKQPMKKVRFLASLTQSGYHLVVRQDSNITSLADLKGQSLATLAPGNIGELATKLVLQAGNMTYQDLSKVSNGSFDDGANQIRDGQVNAYSIMFITPASIVSQLAATSSIDLVSLDDNTINAVTKSNPGYQAATLPPGMYKGIDHPVNTFVSRVNILVSADMPEEVVYKMTKALAENIQTMNGINASFGKFTAKDLAENPAQLPYHDGALKYYREVGAVN